MARMPRPSHRGFAKVATNYDPQSWIRFASILDGMAEEEECQGVVPTASREGNG
jgi:hypothetical protein